MCQISVTMSISTDSSNDFRIRRRNPDKSGVECLVVGCNNRTGKDRKEGIRRSYYCLPKNEKFRKQWLAAIPRTKWTPKAWHRICSDHFIDGKRARTPGSVGSIPTIFPQRTPSSQTKPRTTLTARRALTPLQVAETPKVRLKSGPPVPPTLTNALWQTSDHDYVATRQAPPSDNDHLLQVIHDQEQQISNLKGRVLSLDTIRDNDKDCQFYTNMPNYDVFKAVCDYLEDKAGGQMRYWRGSDTTTHQHFSATKKRRPGPDRKLTFEEEFFLSLVKMKTGSSNIDLARRFGVHEALVSRVSSTWFNFLYQEMRLLFEMVDDEENVAECYEGYVGLKIVVDCTEQQCERSSDLQARKETFSNYKQRDTLKWLIGLSKNLTVNYVSSAYGGRASDKHITLDSNNLLHNLPDGSSVMADRGFPLTNELKQLGVKLIVPDYKGRNRSQMTREECANSEFISKARIHIERIIQRVRTNHILDSTARLSMKDIYHQMFATCAYMCNFQLPIVRATPKHNLVDN